MHAASSGLVWMHFTMPLVQASSCLRRADRNETPPFPIACWHLVALLAATASARPPSSTTIAVGTGVGASVAVAPPIGVVVGVAFSLVAVTSGVAVICAVAVGLGVALAVGVTVTVATLVAVAVTRLVGVTTGVAVAAVEVGPVRSVPRPSVSG